METLPACSLIWANYTGNRAILALEKCYKNQDITTPVGKDEG
jgi:hypothetical protein